MNAKSNNNSPESPDFEHALSELEDLVSRLESGELTLDQSLDCFKRGVELTRHCQTILDQAQQTVELLTRETPEPTGSSAEEAN